MLSVYIFAIDMNVTYNEVFCGCFFQIKDVTNCDIVGVFDFEKGTVWSMLLVLRLIEYCQPLLS